MYTYTNIQISFLPHNHQKNFKLYTCNQKYTLEYYLVLVIKKNHLFVDFSKK